MTGTRAKVKAVPRPKQLERVYVGRDSNGKATMLAAGRYMFLRNKVGHWEDNRCGDGITIHKSPLDNMWYVTTNGDSLRCPAFTNPSWALEYLTRHYCPTPDRRDR